MNNVTSTVITDRMNFEMCGLDQLFEISASGTMSSWQTDYHLYQTVTFCIASIITFCSMSYTLISRYLLKPKGFRLHFIGIGRPQNMNKSQYKLLADVNTEDTLISVQTPLEEIHTISDLKTYIKKLYKFSSAKNDILIVFAHHVISNDDTRTLKDVGVSHNSLLTLAICDGVKALITPKLERAEVIYKEPVVVETVDAAPMIIDPSYDSDSGSDSDCFDGNDVNTMFGMYADYESETEPVQSVNDLFGMFMEKDSDDEEEEKVIAKTPTPPPPTWPRLGFDVITQEPNVLVHKMPQCGHEMNADSLYDFALSTFMDSSNIHLKCPHRHYGKVCDTKWQYLSIVDILNYEDTANTMKDKWLKAAKIELLSARNLIENLCDVQKCPRCQTLYFKNHNDSAKRFEDIQTVEDIEDEFKFACLLCSDDVIEESEDIPIESDEDNKESTESDDEEEEDIDGEAVNALFGMHQNEEDGDSDDEDDYSEALQNIQHMFDGFVEYETKVTQQILNEFCFCCGKEWETEHVCSSSFRGDLLEILTLAETKTIGSVADVPSIRCCPKCCQLIFHVDACKHMKCSRCKTDFCFVCLKQKKDGNWQCGSHCDKCPVADKQNEQTLPNTIVITKKAFKLF